MLLLALACAGKLSDDTALKESLPSTPIPNDFAPEIDIDTDDDGDFDNTNEYDTGEWHTSAQCPNAQLSWLLQGLDEDQANGAAPPQVRVAIYKPYTYETIYYDLETSGETEDYLYLDPSVYLTEVSPGIYRFTLDADDLLRFCDAGEDLYLRIDSFDGEHASDPIDVRVEYRSA